MIDIVEVEPGVFSVLVDGLCYEARVAGDEIFIKGFAIPVEQTDPRKWKRSSSGAAAQGRLTVVAPMPGKVVRVLVSTGDQVEAGQGLIVVEAMKMQNELKTVRAGRVASVNATPGDSVNAGSVLLVIE